MEALDALEAPPQEPPPSTPEPSPAIGLLANPTPAPSWRGGFMIMVVLLVLMFAGAAGAGWMFREPLTRAMTRWHLTR